MDRGTLNSLQRNIRRGNFRVAAEEYSEAFKAFRKALDLIPNSIELHHILAELSFEMNNKEEGLRYLRDAYNLEESDLTREKLALGLLERGAYLEASEVIAQIQDPSDLMQIANFIAAMHLGTQVKIKDSLFLYPPENIEYPFYALYNFQKGNYTVALRQFREYGKGSWQAYHSAGVIYWLTNSPELAHQEFKSAYELYLNEPEQKDDATLRKLQFDMICSQSEPQARIEDLLELELVENEDYYYALAVSYHQLEGFSEQFLHYLKKAIDFRGTEPTEPEIAWIEEAGGSTT